MRGATPANTALRSHPSAIAGPPGYRDDRRVSYPRPALGVAASLTRASSRTSDNLIRFRECAGATRFGLAQGSWRPRSSCSNASAQARCMLIWMHSCILATNSRRFAAFRLFSRHIVQDLLVQRRISGDAPQARVLVLMLLKLAQFTHPEIGVLLLHV